MNSSVDRALRIVELLNQFGRPMALKDVAKALNLNKATAYRLLRSLCNRGLVRNVRNNGSYALGPACLTFAEGFRKSFTMRDRVLPFLEKLVRVTGETAIYCERYGLDACVTVERWDSPHDTRTFSGTGIIRPLTLGASAIAILSMLPKQEVLSIINSTKSNQQDSGVLRNRKLILEKTDEVKARGYSISMRERDLDTGGIAAPVFDDRAVLGSLAIVGPVDRMKRSGIQKLGKHVQKIAAEFTHELRLGSGEFYKAAKRTAS
jgi:DNA-binding IclR family transcriptional regulator